MKFFKDDFTNFRNRDEKLQGTDKEYSSRENVKYVTPDKQKEENGKN